MTNEERVREHRRIAYLGADDPKVKGLREFLTWRKILKNHIKELEVAEENSEPILASIARRSLIAVKQTRKVLFEFYIDHLTRLFLKWLDRNFPETAKKW